MGSIKIKVISFEDVSEIFRHNSSKIFSIVEDSFSKYYLGQVILPAKISQIFDQTTQNRINCMPATILSDKVSGLKWVSVFPSNAAKGKQNVSGISILSEIETGFPIAVIDSTLLTNIRTAAVGCVAAKYLAPSKVETVGFIGCGAEARMHFALLKSMFPTIKECRCSSRSNKTEDAFIQALAPAAPDVSFIACNGDNAKSTNNADIIITAISGQAPVLKADYIKKGCLYIHVGGWEDEFTVPMKANKIVCDEWESCKHRTQTISQMYQKGLLKDDDIYADLGEIITGKKKGRDNDEEFIYFNSVGLSFIDLNFTNEVYKAAIEKGLGTDVMLSTEGETDYAGLI
jgi:ornithine cyclodeaminase/alanine dehydrogenase-like protein (mu-crystallin family)